MHILIFGTWRFSQVMQQFFVWETITVVWRSDPLPSLDTIDIIIPCIPLSAFPTRFAMIKPHLTTQCILDVGSVKIFPFQTFGDYDHVMYTHPMFGPDSVANNGWFAGLPRVICEHPDTLHTQWIRKKITDMGCRVVYLSCEEHDRMAARSQWLAHFVGRMLEAANHTPTPIDTQWAKLLNQIKTQTCNDTLELFRDLQTLNPFTLSMRVDLGRAYESVFDSLLPKRRWTDRWRVGIQWWPGSFNETSIIDYCKKNHIHKLDIVYLYTTQAVVRAVYEGEVDFGHFAVCNSRGGIVDESIASIASYRYDVLDVHRIAINHVIMCLPSMTVGTIIWLKAHPQVFAQCKETLAREYPHLRLETWEGEMIDTARLAQALRDGEIEPHWGIIGNARLAEIYGLVIVSGWCADDPHNETSFFVIQRRG